MNNSGYEGIWDQTFSKLDSRYYIAILSFPWCRYYVDETGFAYEDVENPKHEWRVPAEMSEAANYYDTDTPKLLNTDMCLAWAIGDGDDVNEQTCPTKCMAGDTWDECTNAASEGDTTNMCGESETSPDSPSGKLTLCNKQTNGMREFVEAFAASNDDWLAVFLPTFKKLTELGQSNLTSPTEVTAPADLEYDVDCNSAACKLCIGTAIETMTPSSTGSAVTAYAVSPTLPDGISLETSTGKITGTPTTEQDNTAYTITASNDAGSDTYKVKFRVLAASNNNCASLIQQQEDEWSEDEWSNDE